MLQTETDRVIANTSFFLDGVRFVRCRFVNCQLIYEGRDEVAFQECSFEGCSWTFDGPADHTLVYLSTLYHGMGEEGKHLVEAIFASIRAGKVDHGELLPSQALSA